MNVGPVWSPASRLLACWPRRCARFAGAHRASVFSHFLGILTARQTARSTARDRGAVRARSCSENAPSQQAGRQQAWHRQTAPQVVQDPPTRTLCVVVRPPRQGLGTACPRRCLVGRRAGQLRSVRLAAGAVLEAAGLERGGEPTAGAHRTAVARVCGEFPGTCARRRRDQATARLRRPAPSDDGRHADRAPLASPEGRLRSVRRRFAGQYSRQRVCAAVLAACRVPRGHPKQA